MTNSETRVPIAQLFGITIDVHDLDLEKNFWQAVLGTGITAQNEEWILFEPQPGQAGFSLQKVAEGKSIKNRAHPDLKMADFVDGVRKLKALGAKEVQRVCSGDLEWVVMIDPEGNEFCAIK